MTTYSNVPSVKAHSLEKKKKKVDLTILNTPFIFLYLFYK